MKPASTSRWARPAVVVLAAIFLVLAATSIGCSTFSIRSDRCPAYPAAVAPSTPAAGNVKVQYLGSGGYLVRRGDDVVLFGPQYSNPGISELAVDSQIRTDRALVELLLPEDANLAQAIVIGHAHYDHLMDTPYIANARAKGAKVYGSATMKNLIGSEVALSRIVDVGPEAGTNRPIAIGNRMRLWPIESQHSNQARLKVPLTGLNLALHNWRGEVSTPQSALPTTASGWAEGETYAYVLDFMDATGTNVEFRIYYQDAATDEPRGYPVNVSPRPDGKGVDVLLICAGGDFERLANHPGGLITAARPRFVLLGHWENFFEPQTDICRTGIVDAIPMSDTREFTRRAARAMSKARLPGKPILTCPTASVFHFPMDNANDAAIHQALKRGRVPYDCAKAGVPTRR